MLYLILELVVQLDLKRFEEAIKSKDTELNMLHLTGVRKQSTVDAEILLLPPVPNFFKKNYMVEAKYIATIASWHESTDGRGMTQEQRHSANQDMLDMVKDEWMPWHWDTPDLSLIDIYV